MIRAALLPLLILPGAALAQVAVNHGALDQLRPTAPAAPAPAAPSAAPAAKPAPPRRPAATRPPTTAPAAHAATPAARPRPRPVTVAPAAPPPVQLPPVAEAPRPTTPPPPPVPIVADAMGEFAPIPGGVHITFGPGTSDLNQNTANALRQVAREVKADPAVDLNVFAYSASLPDDPSTARRLSLARALAARAVLISEGIASTRIYVRALGAPPDGLPDRVDLVRAGMPAPGSKP